MHGLRLLQNFHVLMRLELLLVVLSRQRRRGQKLGSFPRATPADRFSESRIPHPLMATAKGAEEHPPFGNRRVVKGSSPQSNRKLGIMGLVLISKSVGRSIPGRHK